MASELERFPDKILFQIIKQIAENCESDRVPLESEINDEIITLIDRTLKIFGVVDDPKYIDDEYLWVILKMNMNKLSDDRLVGNLERPEIKEYEFDIDVSETVYQTQTWRDTVESYGDPYSLVRIMEENADWDYFNGREIDTDIHDSETNDIRINRKSFNEI